jgi:hypothetical protein
MMLVDNPWPTRPWQGSARRRLERRGARETSKTMYFIERGGSVSTDLTQDMRTGWEAALLELRHQAAHLEARGAAGAAMTLYDAIRIADNGGLRCEHRLSRGTS